MNFINGKVVVKENDYCDNPVIGKKYFFTDGKYKTLLDCHRENIMVKTLKGFNPGIHKYARDHMFGDERGLYWKHIIEAKPVVFDKYAKVGEEYYFTDLDVIRNPDIIDKIVKDKKLFKLRHIHEGRMYPFQAGISWKHVIRGI